MTEAPDFIADNAEYKGIHARRETAARQARAAQATYRRLMRGFIAASAAAAIAGGLVLYGIEETADAAATSTGLASFFAGKVVHTGLIILQALAVAVAAACAFGLNAHDYPKIWGQAREQAESLRFERGLAALRIGHAAGPDRFKAAGAYFFDDLVRDQIGYLERALVVHEKGASRLTIFGAIIMAVGIAAPILASAGMPSLILFSALAAILTPALLSGVKSWGEAMASGARRELHRGTLDNLLQVSGRRSELDEALEGHDLDAAMKYADLVIAALKTDLAGFLKLLSVAPAPPPPTLPKTGSKG